MTEKTISINKEVRKEIKPLQVFKKTEQQIKSLGIKHQIKQHIEKKASVTLSEREVTRAGNIFMAQEAGVNNEDIIEVYTTQAQKDRLNELKE